VAKPSLSSADSRRCTKGELHANERNQQQHHDGQVEADRSNGELRDEPTQQFHRRISDREDDLQDHYGDAGGMPVTAERADELDDDPSDEQQPKDEQRKPKDLKEQHQREPDLTDEMSIPRGSAASARVPTRAEQPSQMCRIDRLVPDA
jgi:hypothetical protein